MTNIVHELAQQIEDAKGLLRTYADILGDDADAKDMTLASETDLPEMIERAVTRIIEIAALSEGIDAAMAKLKARKSRLSDQEESLRTLLGVALEVAGKSKIEMPIGTVSLRPVPPSVRVTDEASIPSDFWKPQAPKLDKVALLKALKDKDAAPIPGAELSNGGVTVQIKAG